MDEDEITRWVEDDDPESQQGEDADDDWSDWSDVVAAGEEDEDA